jgi:hypothetical protein
LAPLSSGPGHREPTGTADVWTHRTHRDGTSHTTFPGATRTLLRACGVAHSPRQQ